jgi:hypothetical protein
VGANSKLKREDIAVNGEVNKKSKAKNDIIFIAVILALILALGAFYVFSHGEGDTVTVTVGGVLYGEYPLSEGRTVEIKNGESVNLLIIEGGRARVASASCPDGICAAHKPISRDGESIVCLPNEVVITVNKKSTDSPDIIV